MKILLFVLIQAGANVIQAITGFAGGPLALPPSMALVGVDSAKSSITLIFLFATAIVAFQNRKYINVRQVVKMLCIMMFGFLPGVWLFNHMESTLIMIVYGLVVMCIGIWKLLQKKQTSENKLLGYLALILSGLMQGMFTSGGPFMVIYASAAMKDKDEFRASISTVWAILNLYLVIDMYRQGMFTAYNVSLTAWSMIPVFAAIYIGNRINKKIKQETFVRLVYILLIISGGLLFLNAII